MFLNGSTPTARFSIRIECAVPGDFTDDINVEYMSLLKDGAWHWYAVTWNGSTGPGSAGGVLLYRDGTHPSGDRGVAQDGDSPYLGDFGSDLFIGNSVGTVSSFTGDLDEFRVSSTARGALWIEAQYLSMADAGYLSYGPEGAVPGQ